MLTNFSVSMSRRFRLYREARRLVEERGEISYLEAAEILGCHPNLMAQVFADLGDSDENLIYDRRSKRLYTREKWKEYLEVRRASQTILSLLRNLRREVEKDE